MKKYILTLGIVGGAFAFAMPRAAQAHDGKWDERHHYYIDKDGYWDEHDIHQKYAVVKKHRGYWDTRGEKRIFIRVDRD